MAAIQKFPLIAIVLTIVIHIFGQSLAVAGGQPERPTPQGSPRVRRALPPPPIRTTNLQQTQSRTPSPQITPGGPQFPQPEIPPRSPTPLNGPRPRSAPPLGPRERYPPPPGGPRPLSVPPPSPRRHDSHPM